MVGTIIFYVELNVTARSGACPVVVSNFEIDIHQTWNWEIRGQIVFKRLLQLMLTSTYMDVKIGAPSVHCPLHSTARACF